MFIVSPFFDLFVISAVLSGLTNASALSGLMRSSLSFHPSVRGQDVLSRAVQQVGVASARWQYFPTPSVSAEQVSVSRAAISCGNGDKNVSTLRLQQQIIRRIEEGVSPKSDRTLALGHIDQTRTGTRSVLKYIAKPVFKTFGSALNGR